MKRFKYLYFTNALNKPYFNYWFLKKLKVKEEDDGNYLSQPSATSYEDGGISWTWNKMDVTGEGTVATSGTSYMTDVLPLKKPIETGVSYTFSVAEALPRRTSLYVALYNEQGNTTQQFIAALASSRTFTSNNNYTNFRLYLTSRRGEVLDLTLKDIKIVKDET